MDLERGEDLWFDSMGMLEPEQCVHYLWVVGPYGAASTWFEDTKATLGRSTGGGVITYSLYPRKVTRDKFDALYPDWVPNPGPCRFLDDTQAWSRTCEDDTPAKVLQAYDEGDIEVVWAWLTAHYESDLAKGA